MADINSKIEAAKNEVTSITADIEKARTDKKQKSIGNVVKSEGTTLTSVRTGVKTRRTLRGHFGKVTALHWGGPSRPQNVVSAAQDGTLIVWNAVTTSKVQIISLKSSYVLTVGMEQTKGNMVACGGLDNLCTVYKLSNPNNPIEMASHEGFLSCCRFVNEEHILTSSGDSTTIRWDVDSGRVVDTYAEHRADVMSMCLSPSDPNIFVTGSVDKTAKIWDIRNPKKSIQTFTGHDGDVNSVSFLPSDGNAFGTGSDDGTCRLYDLRSYNTVNTFGKFKPMPPNAEETGEYREGITSIGFSKSGRILFAGHADSNVYAYDVLADKTTPAFTLTGHESHVTSVGVNFSGDALCTSSWDNTLRIWA